MSVHHAYNFVPAPARPAELDTAPAGHDRLRPGLLHGRLTVEMEVITPLLVGEVRRLTAVGDGSHAHLQLRSRRGNPTGAVDGADVEIPVTSVKGILRAAYEAVTNSRFGVFDRHDQPLTYRSATHQALDLVPVRITDTPTGWQAEQLQRAALPSSARGPVTYTETGQGILDSLAHQQQVTATIRRAGHVRKKDGYWIVTHVDGVEVVTADALCGERNWWVDPPQTQTVTGWVMRTNTAPDRPTASNKHDERLFHGPVVRRLTIHPDAPAAYTRVVTSYQTQTLEPPKGAHRSRAATPAAPRELCDGDLLWAVVDPDTNTVTQLLPVLISRRSFPAAPRDLLPESIRPVTGDPEVVSPADRVFGYVAEPDPAAPTERVDAYRGQLVLSPVQPEDVRIHPSGDETARADDADAGGAVLAELSTPKPQAARFYVAADQRGTPLPNNDPELFKSELYQPDHGLRGRKVYPHHRRAEDRDRLPAAALAAIRDGRPEVTERNATAHQWVKPGSRFSFTIDFVNLSDFELGALLWLLTPQQLATGDQPDQRGYFRLGRGKPFGLGSIRLALRAEDSTISRTGDLADAYTQLTGCTGHIAPEHATEAAGYIDEFKRITAAAYDAGRRSAANFDRVPFIQAFRRAASGYPTDIPVSYPIGTTPTRPGETDVGPIVKWFAANERVEWNREAQRNELVQGKSLPPLAGQHPNPLPTLD